MQPDGGRPGTSVRRPDIGGVAIEDVVGIREQTLFEKLISSQPFWVTIALSRSSSSCACLQPQAFASSENFYNITRNFAYIGIMSVGMVAVIITGGIDLSVGSTMGLVGVVCGVILQAGHTGRSAVAAGLATGMLVGLINGVLIAYVGLSAFVVTLGMLSFARSVAIVLSGNKMLYKFGPYKPGFKAIGGGELLGMSNMVWTLIAPGDRRRAGAEVHAWGRHLYSIGGNEQAARLTGVPVDRVKAQAYMLSGLTAASRDPGRRLAGFGDQRARHRLRAPLIASTVIGGANLMGGEGGTYGAVIGSALLEVIRNALLMQGIDSNWQGAFVGVFIVLAVLLEKIRGRRRA